MAVTPAGAPVTVRFTVWAVPEVVAVFTVALVDSPGLTLPVAGLTLTEKSLLGTGPLPTEVFHSV